MGRRTLKLSPVEIILIAAACGGVGIWMILDPSISSGWRGPRSIAACRAFGVAAVLLAAYLIFRAAAMLRRGRPER